MLKSKKSRNMLFLTLSAVLLVVLALTGCGSNNNGNNAPSSAPSNNAANGGSSANTGSDLLNEIKTAGVIKVGLMGTYAPYNFLNENKEIDGFDADVAKEVAKRLGVKVEFAPQEFSGLIPSLQAGKIDAIISQVTITDERKQQIDFTQPYITNEVKILSLIHI